ncbi:hypothetical protein ABZ816_30045 [Actinosynnema sp. NPDC047251]|uniref:Uncharacterized protein n=1 Tax=Saccharothrix espanaensis (strain ATCC 51144 / DSM 44229 / JCM 9112 / NBRC 15066 / NRRL 15764) TaxID=1179773 RepID=K0KAY6_SACES|nr:hypothetical protein [Saccharothrix espanaensis]CCH34677.1 hypothetical protein BN6_74500 [Saccharothrix espanaensis DSM 44229]
MSTITRDAGHDQCHPPREWLVRCSDDAHRPAVCSIAVTNGTVEVWLDERTMISLDGSEVALFQTAFADAAELATTDRATTDCEATDREARTTQP